ncbi:MAG: SDR family NAD(P)-dependent oxidoreductase [Clostridia bacterium]|nr:SDR family NAD(P)-dependent oxidoreductase [Clostridia bacterium]
MSDKEKQSRMFLQKIKNSNYIVRDHRVHGVRVLPGVTLLDMVYRLSKAAVGTQSIELRNIVFKKPVVTSEEFDADVFVSFEAMDSCWRVEITSQKQKNDNPVGADQDENMECMLYIKPDSDYSKKVDVAGLIHSADHQLDMDSIYAPARQNGISHYEFMKTLGTVYQRNNEELMELHLSELAEKYRSRFYAHPAFLDGSTFAGLAFYANGREFETHKIETPFIPFMIKRFCIYQQLPEKIYVYSSRRESNDSSAEPDILSTDVIICNESGEVMVEFEKLVYKRVRQANSITDLTDKTNDIQEEEQGAYTPAFPVNCVKEGERGSKQALIGYLQKEIGKMLKINPGDVSIKAGFYDLGLNSTQLLKLVKTLENELKEELYPTLLFEYSTIEVLAEYLLENFNTDALDFKFQKDESTQCVDSSGRTNKHKLFFYEPVWQRKDVIYPQKTGIRKNNHLIVLFDTADSLYASLKNSFTTADVIRLDSDKGSISDRFEDKFLQLFELIQKQLNQNTGSEQLVQVIADSNGTGSYAYALGALFKTIFLENSGMRSQIITFAGINAYPVSTLAQILINEADSEYTGCAEIQYRGNPPERFVKGLQETLLPVKKEMSYIKDNGVYVITGGMGGLGFLLACHISRKSKIKLALLGRSEPDQQKILQLAQNGAEVIYLKADVSSYPEMAAAFDKIRSSLGPINGVFHCAGILKDQFIIHKNSAEIREVLAPKVGGLHHLDEVTKNDRLDFFVIFSSLSAVLGNVGQGDYASANGFMDCFGMSRQEKAANEKRYGKTITFNWPLWQDGGMHIDKELEDMIYTTSGIKPLPTELGLQALDSIISLQKSQIVILYGDENQIGKQMQSAMVSKADTVKTERGKSRSVDDIAVIGLAGRYPMADSIESYYENLKQGRDCITGFPKDRWKDYQFSYDVEEIYKYGGFIDDIDKFDPLFFNMLPVQAERMDPQARLFLEVAWEACEDAGFYQDRATHNYPSSGNKSVGVFAGVFWSHYELFAAELTQRGMPVSLGSSPAAIPNIVSYCLNFHGPSMAVDTMCSSALTSIHLACESIRRGECGYALAGGVNVVTHPHKYNFLSQANFLSSDGRCRSFGEGGDGYVPGEGVGAVLLTSLEEAEKQGYHIYGVIKGSALNHVGKTSGLTVPDPVAQSEVIAHALENAGVDPATLSYIEAHGTGTSLGDPIEIQGLNKAFSKWTKRKQYCAIGSSKSNIGHLEAAAGIAGLTKVLLQLKYRKLFPSLHSEKVNPYIPFHETPFYLADSLKEWTLPEEAQGEKAGYPRRAGLSSFGASGSNAFIIVEEYLSSKPEQCLNSSRDINPAIITLSARNKNRLKAYVQKTYEFLKKCREHSLEKKSNTAIALTDLAYTLQVGREAMEERLAFVVSSIEEFEVKLKEVIEGKAGIEGVYSGRVEAGRVISEDEDIEKSIEIWLTQRNYEMLAQIWIKGRVVDWNKLYSGIKPHRMSMPTYPFAKERYWISEKAPKLADSTSDFIKSKKENTLKKEVLQKNILLKDWEEKNKSTSLDIASGIVIVLETGVTQKLSCRLFENREEIKVIHVTHGAGQADTDPGRNERIIADFYSAEAGKVMYQEIKDRCSAHKLLGVIDITAYDSAYEESVTIESGKIGLLQKIVEHYRNENLVFLQVTHKLQHFQTSSPTMQGARLAGLYRVLGAEYKQIYSITVDSDCTLEDYEKLQKQIETEFYGSYSADSAECCYRIDKRYEPKLIKNQIENDILKDSLQKESFNSRDVILITGGSRGIGASIAEYVVSCGCRNLVIIGREKLPEKSVWKEILVDENKSVFAEKIGKMQSYIEQGVNVLYYSTPLTDEDGLRTMVDEIHQQAGAISGVYHCAGMMSRSPAFFKKELSDIESVCEPKMKGLRILHKAMENEPLAFFILFSSVSGTIPRLAVGQADYSMANAYMDFYAANQACRRNSCFKAVQWPVWGETGMASGENVTPSYTKTGMEPLSTEDGITFLSFIKKESYNVCLPCVTNGDKFRDDCLLRIKEITEGTAHNDSGANKDVGLHKDLQYYVRQWLREQFMSELKLSDDQLDENKQFSEYGIDSIILAQLVQTLQSGVEKKLEPSLILEYGTISELVDYFTVHHGESFRKRYAVNTKVQAVKIPEQKRCLAEKGFGGTTDDIAVVGLSCRFPGAPAKEDYWQLLTRGLSAIKPVPEKRWQPKNNRIDYGGWLDDAELFDADFFSINEKDAEIMDPQARIILEESLKAIYDAGYRHKDLSGEKVGVYIGGRSQSNAKINAVLNAPNPILGTGQNYMATNISRFFNFRGPSLIVDTACSSGITSMVFASDALQNHRIDIAVAGAVSLLLSPYSHELFDARNILNRDGKVNIFDKNSGGEVLGEGCGVVILKRYSDAVKDGNHIYGVIKAIATNNDGRTLGPGSPNINAQKQVLQDALMCSGRNAEDIGYIEVNGGGSPVVDSVEIKALSDIYHLDDLSLSECYAGSIKPNVGHLLLASGMAGFIRCLLSVHYKQIPPFLSALEPFDYYDFTSSRIRFNRETIEWETAPGKKRIAAQSSFPDGGTNCHIIIEEFVPGGNYMQRYYPQKCPELQKRSFPLSAASSPEALPTPKHEPEYCNGTDLNSIIQKFVIEPAKGTGQESHIPVGTFWGEVK